MSYLRDKYELECKKCGRTSEDGVTLIRVKDMKTGKVGSFICRLCRAPKNDDVNAFLKHAEELQRCTGR